MWSLILKRYRLPWCSSGWNHCLPMQETWSSNSWPRKIPDAAEPSGLCAALLSPRAQPQFHSQEPVRHKGSHCKPPIYYKQKRPHSPQLRGSLHAAAKTQCSRRQISILKRYEWTYLQNINRPSAALSSLSASITRSSTSVPDSYWSGFWHLRLICISYKWHHTAYALFLTLSLKKLFWYSSIFYVINGSLFFYC